MTVTGKPQKFLMSQGSCDPAFLAVRECFERGFLDLAHDKARGEIGAGIAVCVGGRLVVDLWGGHADAARSRPWQRDTLANVFSTTKGIVAIAAHRLVERREARPRLAGRSLLARVRGEWQAGHHGQDAARPPRRVVGVRSPLASDAPYDWQGMTRSLAAEAPFWTPGERHGYHAFSFGWLVGEVIRRVTGLSPGRFIRNEIAVPLSADLHIGTSSSEENRVAELTALPQADADSDQSKLIARILSEPESASAAAFANPPTLLSPAEFNSPAWRRAEIPAANAQATALSLARLYGSLASGGELDGFRLLAAESIDRCSQEESQGSTRSSA